MYLQSVWCDCVSAFLHKSALEAAHAVRCIFTLSYRISHKTQSEDMEQQERKEIKVEGKGGGAFVCVCLHLSLTKPPVWTVTLPPSDRLKHQTPNDSSDTNDCSSVYAGTNRPIRSQS